MTHAKLIVERGLRPFLLLLTSATWLACGDDSSSAAGSGGAAGAPLGGGGSGAAGSGGASVNFAACDQPTDCGLVQPGCCPICELPTLADVEPIDIALAEAFYESTCNGVDLCACDGLVNPNLYAVCNAGTCEKADVRAQRSAYFGRALTAAPATPNPTPGSRLQQRAKLRFRLSCAARPSATPVSRYRPLASGSIA
jgi:hypothetical protein